MHNSLELFRKNVKQRLQELGMNANDLAKMAGMPPSSVSIYLSKQKPSLPVIDRFAEALKTTASQLVCDPEADRKIHTHDLSDCLRAVAAAATEGRSTVQPTIPAGEETEKLLTLLRENPDAVDIATRSVQSYLSGKQGIKKSKKHGKLG